VRNVELRSVSLGFGAGASRTTALDAVDLVLEPGVFTLISGPSGSGKTSLISVLGAMITPDSGEVLVEDNDITGSVPIAGPRSGASRSAMCSSRSA
jgi:putative ABC transport system ATP-binding protein